MDVSVPSPPNLGTTHNVSCCAKHPTQIASRARGSHTPNSLLPCPCHRRGCQDLAFAAAAALLLPQRHPQRQHARGCCPSPRAQGLELRAEAKLTLSGRAGAQHSSKGVGSDCSCSPANCRGEVRSEKTWDYLSCTSGSDPLEGIAL